MGEKTRWLYIVNFLILILVLEYNSPFKTKKEAES